jgi:hypothetical protein
MYRRSCVSIARGLFCSGLLLGCLLGQHATAQPRHTVSAEQMHSMVAQQFPRRYPVAGLMRMDVQAPALRLLPNENRLSAEMEFEATGVLLGGNQKGALEVDFALRFEAMDNTVRAHRLRFKRLRMANLSAAAAQLLNTYGQLLADQTLQEVVVHTLRPQDMAVAEDLGLQPSSITVTDTGIVVGFEIKALR